MTIPFCPGYNQEPFATLVANYPGKDVHPVKDFRVAGASFSQGTVGLDGANLRDWSGSRSDISPPSNSAGTAGKRVHGFLKRLGFTELCADKHISKHEKRRPVELRIANVFIST